MLTGSLAVQAQTFTPHYTGPYAAESGKFFVRFYVVYFQTSADLWADNLGAVELQQRTDKTFALLNQAFNQHDVYFVPGESESGTCYEIFTREGQEPWPEYPAGLVMYVYSDDSGSSDLATGQVINSGLPAKSFFVQGSEDGVPGSNLPVVLHEVGHCFGLAHTFENTDSNGNHIGPSPSCTSSGACASGYGTDSNQCCGDMVGDTPPHASGDILIASDCASTTSPTGLPPSIFKNYMAYSYPTRCRDHFSPQQINRMRKYLKNASILQDILVVPETIATGTPVTWSTPQQKSTHIEIPSGATLIVDDLLEMAPNTYIIVRRGGTLLVNGTITAGCGGMWGGIVVEGNVQYSQNDQNGQPSSAQGRFVLNADGIIEHAASGVAARGFEFPIDFKFGGGIVEIYGRIRNCTHSLRLSSFLHLGLPNASTVNGAFFTLDDDYRGTAEAQPVFVSLQKINLLNIKSAWFYDNRTQQCTMRQSRALGIVADDAAFRVRTSQFRNLDRAILADPLLAGGEGAYEVDQGHFFDCYTGIESSLPDVFSIVNSYFEVGRPPMCPEENTAQGLVGVLLNGHNLPSGIAIANNQFKPGNYEETEILVGVDCLGAGTADNTIRHNTFLELAYGNRANGNNGSPNSGLQYTCNKNYDNYEADFWVQTGSVRGTQGEVDLFTLSSTAAGNRFSGVGYTWVNAGAPITYYYWEDDPNQDPNVSIGFDPILKIDPEKASFPNPSCATFIPDCPPPCTVTETEVWTDQFFQEQTSWLTKKAQYPTLTDTAAQDTLLREIFAHRAAMDYWGGRMIRNFALDSTGAKTDSVLLWTRHLHRYEADLRLARHAFFSSDFSTYGAWLDSIPARHDLTDAQADELAEFAAMLAVVRPHAEAETDLYHLPASVLDSLAEWASGCNEPGFVAKVLLRRNGREATTDCSGTTAQRPATSTAHHHSLRTGGIRIFPNPTTGQFFVSLPEGSGPVHLALHRSDGRLVLEQQITAATTVDASHLPPGIYFCRVANAGGVLLVTKLVVSR